MNLLAISTAKWYFVFNEFRTLMNEYLFSISVLSLFFVIIYFIMKLKRRQ